MILTFYFLSCRFLKSAALEINIPDEITSGGRYSPRFIGDDIDSEIDVIEDKHAPVFSESRSSKCKLTKLTLVNFLFSYLPCFLL